jgi:phospholipid-binding lipoprotein MlaA
MRLMAVLLILLSSGLAGCATTGGVANPRDPLEGFNRAMYTLNQDLDGMLLKPVADVYDVAVPQFVDDGLTNVFSNLDDLGIVFHGLMQLKFSQAGSDLGRFGLNSTLGVLGFFEVASGFGFPKHNEDFGQTLGFWGVESGSYLVLPLFGPSSLRDAVGRGGDIVFGLRTYIPGVRTRNTLRGVEIVDTRSDLKGKENVLDTAATDPYSFLRDAYLQRREVLVRDGEKPAEAQISDDELFDDLPAKPQPTPEPKQ